MIKFVLESCIKPFTIPTAAEIATINRIPKINASTNLIPPLKSQKEYLHNLNQFLRFQTSRNKLLKDSTAIDLAAFLKSKKETCTGKTRKRKYFALKKFYKFLKKTISRSR